MSNKNASTGKYLMVDIGVNSIGVIVSLCQMIDWMNVIALEKIIGD